MPGRTSPIQTAPDLTSAGGKPYRYGFNGKESDFEVKNIGGSSYDFGARIYDSRLGRWFSPDPSERKTPGISTYSFSFDSPIIMHDPNGKDGRLSINYETGTITLETTVHLYGPNASENLAAKLNSNFDKTAPSPRKFVDGDGKEWTVQICVTYTAVNKKVLESQTKEALESSVLAQVSDVKDKSELSNFQEGDNILYASDKILAGAYELAGSSGSVVGAENQTKAFIHGPFHNLGYSDPGKGGSPGWVATSSPNGDVMDAGGDYSTVGTFNINAIHYTDLIQFAKDKSKGQSTTTPIVLSGSNAVEKSARANVAATVNEVKKAEKQEIK